MPAIAHPFDGEIAHHIIDENKPHDWLKPAARGGFIYDNELVLYLH